MRKLVAVAALFLTILAVSALEVPRLTGRVVDRAGVFGADGSARIEQAIRELENATGGGQMAVLTVPSLEGDAIEEFGIAVMDQWKIGNKEKDDGAILIIAVKDRKMRLEIGYGWEGQINDARAGDVIRGMAPYFRENRYADGAVYAVGEVQRFVTGEAAVVEHENASGEEQKDGGLPSFLFVLIFTGLVLFAIFRGGGRHYGGFGGGGFGGGGGGFGGGGGRGGGGGASGGW